MLPVVTRPSVIARGLRRFVADERAATAVEYALIAAGIAVAIASTVWGLGSQLKTAFYDKISAGFN